jgi:SAM-dependent methyltransferase
MAAPRTDLMFEWLADTSPAAAAVIAPLVVDLVGPESVIDIGCGLGDWLAEFQRLGVDDVVGVDGDYVDRAELRIPAERFRAVDLSHTLEIEGRFDLAICLEVGEHLPAARAPELVARLTALAPAILFSAAIPGQGGVGHINEQWPPYWRVLFEQHDYRPLDVVRPKVWDDDRIAYWYRQNILLYADAPTAERVSAVDATAEPRWPDRLVHPDAFARMTRLAKLENHSAVALTKAVPKAAVRAARTRLDRRSRRRATG